VAASAFVSVVTPVYNGGRYLDACIDSVRAQSHGLLEHVILDNASRDETAAIAARHAGRDRRVRVHRNLRKVARSDNWNRALELISPEARYCWLLPADGLIYPRALERMVDVGLRNPSVGIVGALRRHGEDVECKGLPTDREVFSGRKIGRLFLAGRVFAIAPTTNLMRADLVRARRPFYPAQYMHDDIAAFLEVLRTCDFGFVHDVLAFSRPHEVSVSAAIAAMQKTTMRDYFRMLIEYGPGYFESAELGRIERRHLRRYCRALLRTYVMPGGAELRRQHLAALSDLGRVPGPATYGLAIAEKALRLFAPRH
jgi:glycosyltransferase involved in cell wall biosynthesis